MKGKPRPPMPADFGRTQTIYRPRLDSDGPPLTEDESSVGVPVTDRLPDAPEPAWYGEYLKDLWERRSLRSRYLYRSPEHRELFTRLAIRGLAVDYREQQVQDPLHQIWMAD